MASWSATRGRGQIYNVAGAEVTSIIGAVQLMARAVGVEADVVHVPMDIAEAAPALVHWGEALTGGDDVLDRQGPPRPRLDPRSGSRPATGTPTSGSRAGGRDRYEFDFAGDDECSRPSGDRPARRGGSRNPCVAVGYSWTLSMADREGGTMALMFPTFNGKRVSMQQIEARPDVPTPPPHHAAAGEGPHARFRGQGGPG